MQIIRETVCIFIAGHSQEGLTRVIMEKSCNCCSGCLNAEILIVDSFCLAKVGNGVVLNLCCCQRTLSNLLGWTDWQAPHQLNWLAGVSWEVQLWPVI